MTVEIRALAPAEAGKAHQLLVRITKESFNFPKDALERYWSDWSAEALEARARNPKQVVLAAWDSSAPIGLVLGTSAEGGVATVVWLLVESAHANRGVGAKLFAEMKSRYIQAGAHKVKLTAPSERARDFYVRQGMEVEGFHREHWWRRDFWALGMQLNKQD